MVDVSVLGTDVEKRVGSSPTKGRLFKLIKHLIVFFLVGLVILI